MENAGQQRPAQAAPQQQASLIRPEQVSRLPQLTPQQKQQYEQAVRKFWEVMNSTPQGEPRYNEAFTKLVSTSQTLMQGMKNFQIAAKRRQQAAQQAAQGVQAGQAGQPGPGQMPQQPQQPQPANNVQFTQLLPDIQDKVNSLTFFYPPAMIEGTKQAEDWLREAKGRYGQALQRLQIATQKMNDLKQQVAQRQQQNNPLNASEQEGFRSKVQQCQKAITESQNFMEKFRAQQSDFRAQQPQHQYQKQQQAQQGSSGEAQPPSSAGGMQQTPQGPPAYSISAAVTAARSQQAQAGTGQTGSPSNINGPQPPNPAASATPIKAESQEQSVFATQQQPGALNNSLPQSAGPRPPSQPQALQQHASQQNIHAHPLSANLNTAKAPTQAITKHLQVQDPRAVQMPPSRPTLTGGAGVGLPGQLGQPAIATLPGYVLETSEDGRVLSKKKLNELLREVVGPGPDGEEQYLTPDAEEVPLFPNPYLACSY